MTQQATPVARTDRRPPQLPGPRSGMKVVGGLLVRNGLWIGLLLLVAVLATVSPSFGSAVNLQNVLSQNAVIGVVSCGMLVMMIAGGFDMSVGASGGLIVVTVAFVSGYVAIEVALLLGLLIGIVVGLINGLIVVRFRVNSFISTLAVSSVVSGLTLVATNAAPTQGDIGFLADFAFSGVLGVPWLFIVFLAFALLTHVMLSSTKLGHWIYSTGANKNAAYLSGVPVALVRIGAFTFGGLAVAVGATLLLSQSAVGQPSAGSAWPLNAIATCVIAGTSLAGGVGRVSNLIAAVLILGVVSNGLNQLGVSTYWQPAVSGVVILVAVIVDQFSNRRRES
jgi:ribose/xylose/arabinose/galactoside ABC-type transport system permease subunit